MGKKRIDTILDIIKDKGYVTVKYLCEELHYSTATINRDLNILQNQKLILRHYGGAELTEQKGAPLVFRYHKMRPVKNVLGKRAAELIKDGMTVFIDGSTTAQSIAKHITHLKDLTVITNNMNLVSYLCEFGINCVCLGGSVIDPPYILGGSDTSKQAGSYHADIMFFSTGGISEDGKIYNSELIYELHRIMAENSDKTVFLVDHKKVGVKTSRVFGDVADVGYVISDYDFSPEVKRKASNTEFILVETPKTQA